MLSIGGRERERENVVERDLVYVTIIWAEVAMFWLEIAATSSKMRECSDGGQESASPNGNTERQC
jgi:hypothetical protein